MRDLMKLCFPHLNLALAWLWILLGFASGMMLGLFFHQEGWLGGYASLRRRMYRLAHISFFGLGAVNLLFWLTMKTLRCDNSLADIASWAFVLGAVSMPLCCVVMAHFRKATMIFSVPVISLLLGGVLMVVTLLRDPVNSAPPVVAVVAAARRDHRISGLGFRNMRTGHSKRQHLTLKFSTPFDL